MRLALLSLTLCTAILAAPISNNDNTLETLKDVFGVKRSAPFHTPETFPFIDEIDLTTNELGSEFGEDGIPVVKRSS